jgi:hypothetical protein
VQLRDAVRVRAAGREFGIRHRSAGAVIPGIFLAVVTLIDVLSPDWRLLFSPPLIVLVPVLAAAISGIPAAIVYTVLGIASSYWLAVQEYQHRPNLFVVQVTGLVISFGISLLPGWVRSRRERTVRRLRSVSETVQRAVLFPVPERLGDLRAAAFYLAAQEEARIGGDLYEIVDTPYGARMIIGDVRGKGLPAVAASTNMLGAFREAAPYAATLSELAERLESSVRRYQDRTGGDIEEFVTATLVSVPARPYAEVVCCGHPGPLLLRDGEVTQVTATRPSPPFGIRGLSADTGHHVDTVPFDVGDCLVLYTDGVTEARDTGGGFYPLADRIGQYRGTEPRHLIAHVISDLDSHTHGRLGDDAALLVGMRTNGRSIR